MKLMQRDDHNSIPESGITAGVNRRWVLAGLGAGAGLAGIGNLTSCAGQRSRGNDRRLTMSSDIDAAISRALAMDLAPALSVAVYSRDGVYAQAFGLADVDSRERASADTAFYIASSTKSMTALALACLHSRGVLDLDATLAEFSAQSGLPTVARPAEVRLRNLLTHTSGIANEPIEYRLTSTGQHDPDTLWRLLGASEANTAAPLGRFQYANVGYNIATILSDRRLSRRWQDLLRIEIFEPAAMKRTTASMSQAKASGWSIAKPHRLAASGRRERSYLEKTDQTMHSAGGVIMSAQDAIRWLELMIDDGRVGGRRCVPADVVQGTRAPIAMVGVEFEGYRREHYGLGWYIGPYRNERMLHHFGGFSGFRAHISYLPDQAIGIAAFINDSTIGLRVVNALASYIYDRAGGYADADQRFANELDTAATRYRESARRQAAEHSTRKDLPFALVRPPAAYAGAYENPLWGRIEIAADERTLHLTCGVLRAVAEPFDGSDAVWVELQPGDGGVLRFEGDDAVPQSLTFEGERFQRVT